MALVSQGRLTVKRCDVCDVDVRRFASQFNIGTYCSKKCYQFSMIGKQPHNKSKKLFDTKFCVNCSTAMTGAPFLMRRRKFCSQKCCGAYFSGDRCPSWNGGHSKEGRREFGSTGYKFWRSSVLVRDGGKCRWCDSEGVRTYHNLEIHHIIPVAANPDGALDIFNGITLCQHHHALTLGREDVYAETLASIIGHPLRTSPVTSNPGKKALNVAPQELARMYWGEGLSSNEIGVKLGVTGACVLKYMKRYGLPRQLDRRRAVNAS